VLGLTEVFTWSFSQLYFSPFAVLFARSQGPLSSVNRTLDTLFQTPVARAPKLSCERTWTVPVVLVSLVRTGQQRSFEPGCIINHIDYLINIDSKFVFAIHTTTYPYIERQCPGASVSTSSLSIFGLHGCSRVTRRCR
jgi:hypothetical protein